MRNDVVLDDAHADGIGQHAFQTVAGFKGDLALIVDHEDEQAIVFGRFTDGPMIEQFGGEVFDVGIAHRLQGDHHDFGGTGGFNVVQQLIDGGLRGIVKQVVGVDCMQADIVGPDIGHFVYRPFGCLKRGGGEQ